LVGAEHLPAGIQARGDVALGVVKVPGLFAGLAVSLAQQAGGPQVYEVIKVPDSSSSASNCPPA